MEEEQKGTFVKVDFKKSSSTGKVGYDIQVQCAPGTESEALKALLVKAYNAALLGSQYADGLRRMSIDQK